MTMAERKADFMRLLSGLMRAHKKKKKKKSKVKVNVGKKATPVKKSPRKASPKKEGSKKTSGSKSREVDPKKAGSGQANPNKAGQANPSASGLSNEAAPRPAVRTPLKEIPPGAMVTRRGTVINRFVFTSSCFSFPTRKNQIAILGRSFGWLKNR